MCIYINSNFKIFKSVSFFRASLVSLRCVLVQSKKRAKIRNRYNQVPHLTQDTNGKVTTSQLELTYEGQEVSPFPAGDHKSSINRHHRNKGIQHVQLSGKYVLRF